MLLQVVMPTETANAAIRSGQFGPFVQKVLGELKPEAAYFTDTNGCRSGYIFFDMTDSSQIPSIAEPWFLALNATISLKPAMSAQDLGGPAGALIEKTVKTYPKALGS
jgi:hypothetical protein